MKCFGKVQNTKLWSKCEHCSCCDLTVDSSSTQLHIKPLVTTFHLHFSTEQLILNDTLSHVSSTPPALCRKPSVPNKLTAGCESCALRSSVSTVCWYQWGEEDSPVSGRCLWWCWDDEQWSTRCILWICPVWFSGSAHLSCRHTVTTKKGSSVELNRRIMFKIK